MHWRKSRTRRLGLPRQTEPSTDNALGSLPGFDEATYVGVRRLAAKWCAEGRRGLGGRVWWCEEAKKGEAHQQESLVGLLRLDAS